MVRDLLRRDFAAVDAWLALDIAAAVGARAIAYADGVNRGLYVPLGQGSARISAVRHALERAGYDGWYVFEQDVMLTRAPDGRPARIRASLGFVKAR